MSVRLPAALLALALAAPARATKPVILSIDGPHELPPKVQEDLAEPPPMRDELEYLRNRVQALEAVFQPATSSEVDTDAAREDARIERQIEMNRPFEAGPYRPRVVLDLDGNQRLTDLGPRGSGRDGILLVGFASVEATSPWQELKAYDTNFDGVIDREDYEFDRVQIWIDADEDLVPSAPELHKPRDLGIQRIAIPGDLHRDGQAKARGRTLLAGVQSY